jgi:Transposase DDE domain
MADWLFERFVKATPITVMVRATLENAFSPEAIDRIFAETAEKQHEGELLFSSVVELLALVVWRQKKSVGEAYQHAREQFDVSVRSVYNKLNGTETQVCRALVREPADRLGQTVDALSRRKPLLSGYQTRIIDGNHLTSTEHRLKVLRRTRSGPLPGQTLAVLDADRMLIVDLFCSEDGEAQERRLFPEVIPSVEKGQLWIADRNFCTTRFLFGLARRGACFIIRQHASTLSWQEETKLKRVGRCDSGVVYAKTLYLLDGNDVLPVRSITIRLDQPTTSGETEIHLLTNLPSKDASDFRVAELYLNRWTIENAFQEIEHSLRSEIDTLGYPGAALLGFAIAVITYNVLSVVKWAIEAEHHEVIQRECLSGYYLASIVSADYGGMLIALPEKKWTVRFATLKPAGLARQLRTIAKHVRPEVFRKTVRGPKRPRPRRSSGRKFHHVSTAKLLEQQK